MIVPGHEPREPTTMRLLGPLWVVGEGLVRHPQVLGSVDGQPDALVPQRPQLALRGECREGRRLVVAALGKALERLLAQGIDPAADPLVEPRRLAETRHQVVV